MNVREEVGNDLACQPSEQRQLSDTENMHQTPWISARTKAPEEWRETHLHGVPCDSFLLCSILLHSVVLLPVSEHRSSTIIFAVTTHVHSVIQERVFWVTRRMVKSGSRKWLASKLLHVDLQNTSTKHLSSSLQEWCGWMHRLEQGGLKGESIRVLTHWKVTYGNIIFPRKERNKGYQGDILHNNRHRYDTCVMLRCKWGVNIVPPKGKKQKQNRKKEKKRKEERERILHHKGSSKTTIRTSKKKQDSLQGNESARNL